MLKYSPTSLGAQLGKARALDRLSKVYKSNELLREAVEGYEKLITDGRLLLKNQSLYVETAGTCIDRMRFLGLNKRAVIMQKYLVKNFPDEVAHRNQLAILLIISNQLEEARRCLHETLLRWRDNGLALVHYGFVVKQLGGDLNVAAGFLREGIETNAEGTQDGLFYLTLGDTLIRLGRAQEAAEVFSRGAVKKLFLSPHQRSLYNVPRLQSRPFWTLTETTYEKDLAEIKRHWQTIAEEGVRVLEERKLFLEEAENLRERGDWKQFELFSRGRKVVANCEKTPRTCALIDKFEASKCSRGQVKFSVMLPGTHVWPHCGPTNCRLRAHLGLVVPPLTHIRVVNETRSWKAGEWLIFDDSFEHEVWHNGTSTRLVLIVDMWHPDLTADERRSLAPI